MANSNEGQIANRKSAKGAQSEIRQRRAKRNRKLDYGLLLALILPLFAVMPLLTHAGLPNTADGPAHLMRQVELNQAWQQGNFYPRWGTDLALGHGMPIFSYAPPLLYQLTQLFHLSGLPLDEAMKGVVILDFLLYSLGMFLFTRRIYGLAPALAAAAVYVYAPYRLREAYIQGNYGQFTGLAFYPLILWAFHGLITEGRSRWLAAAALTLAGLLLSHNISFMLFAPLLAAYVLFLLVKRVSRVKGQMSGNRVAGSKVASSRIAGSKAAYVLRSLLSPLSSDLSPLFSLLSALFLGLGLSAIFWLPAFGERNQIKLEGITRGFFDFRENFIPLTELLSRPLPLDLAAINPKFPLSVGWPQLLGVGLALLGVLFLLGRWVVRRMPYRTQVSASAHQRIIKSINQPYAIRHTEYVSALILHPSSLAHTLFFALFFLLYAFLALPQSQPVWETIPLLALTEFPWRMLGPAICCAAVLAAAGVSMVNCELSVINSKFSIFNSPFTIHHSPFIILLFIIIALNAYYLYPSQFIAWGTPAPADAFAYEVTSGAIGTTSTGEFLPRWAQAHPRPETLWPDYQAGRLPQKIDPAALPPGATARAVSHLAESDTIQIDTPQPFVATIRTLYWPGWQVYLDNHPATFIVTDQTGLIQTTIPAGQHTLSLRLESTPLRALGQWLTIISILVLIVIVVVAVKKPSSALTGQQTGEPASHQTEVKPSPFTPLSSPLLFFVFLLALYLLSRPLAPLFTLRSDPDRPHPTDRVLQVDFSDQMRLVGLDNLPETVPPGEPLAATLYWRALRNLNTNYSVFLHLDAPNGQTFATVDEVNPEDIPTANWPPGLYLRNSLSLKIPTDIPPIRYGVNVGVYNRETDERLPISPGQATTFQLGTIWLTPPQINPISPPLAHFGPNITLHRAAFDGEALGLLWQTVQPLEQNYTIFVHLLDVNGQVLAQADGAPYAGLYPLTNWRPGQLITDARPVQSLLPNQAALRAIAVGIYDSSTGERLSATDANDQPLLNHSYLIPVTP